jgi:ParB-like chromosome segregation protein Spo0J
LEAVHNAETHSWSVDPLVPYARNPRKNDAAVERMTASIREFGFKIPVLARSDGEVVDGHLRLKAAKKLGIREVPVILCDEWTAAQVKAFRLMVNRSVGWAEWDDELLSLELAELKDLDFDLDLTGFDSKELDRYLAGAADSEGLTTAKGLLTMMRCRKRRRRQSADLAISGYSASIGYFAVTPRWPATWSD